MRSREKNRKKSIRKSQEGFRFITLYKNNWVNFGKLVIFLSKYAFKIKKKVKLRKGLIKIREKNQRIVFIKGSFCPPKNYKN